MSDIKKKITVTIKEYYMTLLLFGLATMQMMLMIYQDYNGIVVGDDSIRLVMTLIYGAILATIIKSVSDYTKQGYSYFLIPIMMLIVYFGILSDFTTLFTLLKYLILCVSTSILFLVIPFLGKKEDSDYYSYKVILGLGLTVMCYLLIILGIFMIMGSIAVLFEITIAEYIYPEIAIFILGILMPSLFLALIPETATKREDYPGIIKKVMSYIILPLLTIYTVVLYAYFIKILIQFNWPSNMLGNLVIYYSLIAIMVLYFANRIKWNDKWSIKFLGLYPYALILPMLMMASSFIIRINQYGVTEPRYYALMIFVWVIGSIVMIKKMDKVKYIPLGLTILLLIATFGPQSAMNVSSYSQEKRLEQLLIDNGMLKDNEIIKNSDIKEPTKSEIYNILIYFDDYHKLKDIDILPTGFNLYEMDEVFGFSYNQHLGKSY